jgi:hypothetical protein
MKYFTPDLYIRGQSHDDNVLDEVDRLWEEAGERYAAYLNSVRPEFPAGLRHLDHSYYLHDAEVRDMAKLGSSFIITLQLDTPPQSLLTFTFDLVQEPVIQKGVFPPELCGTASVAEWMYEEWEKVGGDPPIWAVSILLSNGWEVRLHFRDVQVQEAQAVLPPPRPSSMSVPVMTASQSGS